VNAASDKEGLVERPSGLTPPRLIWVIGPAGSGKRTLSKRIAEELPCLVRLDKDTLQTAMIGDDRSSSIYKTCYQRQSYEALWALARDNIMDGKSVLIHSSNRGLYEPFYPDRSRERFKGTTVLFKVIYCIAPEDVIRKWLKSRAYSRDAAKYSSEDAWAHYVTTEPQFHPPPVSHLRIDTSRDVSRNVKKAREYILDPESSF
jgi:predicted kinase